MNGTLAVMKAARASGVKRVVVTSSIASISNIKEENAPDDDVFNESHWTELDAPSTNAYCKSKTLAERAAWEYLEKLPENERFGLTTINPGFVFGPTLVSTGFSSGEVIKNLMVGTYPVLIKLSFPSVDVRDVALAHFRALTTDEA